MNFDEHKPIYLQISDTICEKILNGEYPEEERIPSIREMGGLLGVNPNTVMRSFEYLKSMEVIYDKRGVGFFTSSGAKKAVMKMYKKDFLETEIPVIARKMNMLDISMDDLTNKLQSELNKK